MKRFLVGGTWTWTERSFVGGTCVVGGGLVVALVPATDGVVLLVAT